MSQMGKVVVSNQFHGRVFRESRLRDAIGPSNPLYHLLRPLTVDMYMLTEEWDGTINADKWTTGGASATNWAATGNPGGRLDATTDPTTEEDCTILSSLVFMGNRRPVGLFRFGTDVDTIATYKFEVGFTDATDNEGAVAVKTTPTATAADAAVVIFDTDDTTNVSLDMVTVGGTDAVNLTVGTPNVTVAINTYYNIMIALDEHKTCRYWIDNVYQGSTALGPDVTVPLGLWLEVCPRTGSARDGYCSYVKAWQERESQT